MATLKHSSIEPNHHNKDGYTLVLYFEGTPTREEVVSVCDGLYGKHSAGSVDTKDPSFSYEEHPTPVSQAAGLRRYECYPFG
jgi:hypothetical protein